VGCEIVVRVGEIQIVVDARFQIVLLKSKIAPFLATGKEI
jgi:hypothetical protein